VLQKLSATNYDTGWTTPAADFISSVTSPLSVTSGDLTVDLSAYLPVSGGTLDANGTITASTATVNSLFAGDTFGVELSANPSENASLQYNGVQVQNAIGSMLVTASGLTFPNLSTQSIAFPGFNNAALTGNPTAPTPATSDNDTSIATTAYVKAQPFGDRYLTTSTTSNTISNTNKTFTIGTGLSYTPTQNITISYDASNHMHGEVLTYSTSTGVLTVDINHNTGSGTYASWVVNVGGVTPATSVAFADITGAVSGNANLQAALDLKANLASPTFTGTPSLPTGTIATTQSPGNNTTALATTAFVTAAVPAFATVPQVLTLTSTTTAISPLNNYIGSLNPAHFSPDVAQLSSTVTGTGSSSTLNANGYTVQLGSTVGSYATRSQTLWPNRVAVTGNLQWTRPVGFSARVAVYNRMDVNAQWGISFGQATATLATPTVRSIGCYFAASAANTPGVLVLEVHDGTSYYTVNSSFTPTFNQLFDVVCYSDGAGNAYLYVNGSQVATSANAPSTNGGTTYQTVLQAGYKAVGTPTGTSNSVFQCLKFLTN
jgi:hypothetical protein